MDVAAGEGGYETNPRYFTDLMHSYIEEATRRGVYVLIDWHQLDPGDPNAHTSQAKTSFTEIAQRHKDKTNLIYDIANEPTTTGTVTSPRWTACPASAGVRDRVRHAAGEW
ncbi:cellulase family glycosylhydrolase [Lentzea sp. CC55]|uniref:cellulase family glycosylhydrolase n=1 Tax=Lentzea sp. CC55 TaxID=2884909 RepID=UPI001F1638CF|nr:cellulase family glycosylhydrolase [Lentzea sp. CC55]MCG8923489.1 glycoside hydrolase family 5 protein [Lentzea sp. CC55]